MKKNLFFFFVCLLGMGLVISLFPSNKVFAYDEYYNINYSFRVVNKNEYLELRIDILDFNYDIEEMILYKDFSIYATLDPSKESQIVKVYDLKVGNIYEFIVLGTKKDGKNFGSVLLTYEPIIDILPKSVEEPDPIIPDNPNDLTDINGKLIQDGIYTFNHYNNSVFILENELVTYFVNYEKLPDDLKQNYLKNINYITIENNEFTFELIEIKKIKMLDSTLIKNDDNYFFGFNIDLDVNINDLDNLVIKGRFTDSKKNDIYNSKVEWYPITFYSFENYINSEYIRAIELNTISFDYLGIEYLFIFDSYNSSHIESVNNLDFIGMFKSIQEITNLSSFLSFVSNFTVEVIITLIAIPFIPLIFKFLFLLINIFLNILNMLFNRKRKYESR